MTQPDLRELLARTYENIYGHGDAARSIRNGGSPSIPANAAIAALARYKNDVEALAALTELSSEQKAPDEQLTPTSYAQHPSLAPDSKAMAAEALSILSTGRDGVLKEALGRLASAAAGVMQSNQKGNEPDFVPLMNAYKNATKLLKSPPQGGKHDPNCIIHAGLHRATECDCPLSAPADSVTDEMVEVEFKQLVLVPQPPSEGMGYELSKASIRHALQAALTAKVLG